MGAAKVDGLEASYAKWQLSRENYFDLLDKTIAGQPMDWEKMTAAIAEMDRTMRDFMAVAKAGGARF
jgi:hypothetical protein